MTGGKRGRPHGGPHTTSPPHTLPAVAVIDDALGRTIAIREALEDGAYGYAGLVAADLEHDLAGNLSQLREAAA